MVAFFWSLSLEATTKPSPFVTNSCAAFIMQGLALICAVRWRDMSANDTTIAESERRIGVEKSQETTS